MKKRTRPYGVLDQDTVKREVELEDEWENEFTGEDTLWFSAPMKLLNGKYPEAESATLELVCELGNPEKFSLPILISPTKDGEDYDWDAISVDPEIAWQLLIKAGKVSA
jgi:hypothetical protein